MPGLGTGLLRVEAESTVFYAQPDGRLSLVRFFVSGVDAPAGRLRVYDRRRRLLGTAGVIRSGNRLYGELWLALEGETRIRSDLEAPGVRGVFRTNHRLRPQRRWTIHWLTVVDPRDVVQVLEELPPFNRAIQAGIFAAAGVVGNPLPEPRKLDVMDHTEFLRMALPAWELQSCFGIPTSAVAVTDPSFALPGPAASALVGSGVQFAVRSTPEGAPFEWWQAPDGSRLLLAAMPPRSDPRSLGFDASRDAMSRRIERWLTASPLLLSQAVGRSGGRAERGDVATTEGVTFAIGSTLDDVSPAMLAAVQEWNQRFAFPRIVIGGGEILQTVLGQGREATTGVYRPRYATRERLPGATALRSLADVRAADALGRAQQMMLPLATALPVSNSAPGSSAGATALGAVADQIAADLPGTLVVNTSPYLRTDVVLLANGRQQVVTDVPPVGYAYIVDPPSSTAAAAAPAAPAAPSLLLEGASCRLRLDDRSGAIASLVTTGDGREWIRTPSDGLNAVPGAILEKLRRETIPGVGVRLIAERWSPARGEVRSTVTVYDALPWVDIENHAAALGDRPMVYLFPFHLPMPQVAWEVPAGFEEAPVPLDGIAHLRWVQLRSQGGTALFRGLDAPFLSVSRDGTVVSFGPRARARYRLWVTSGPVGPSDGARFGWGAEPFVTTRVTGNATGRLPRYGPLLVVDQPGVGIVGLKPADDGNGIVVYVQETQGTGRFISLGAGLLRFRSARRVDYLERDTGEELAPVPDGVTFHIAARGATALRLLDVELRQG